MADFAVGVPYPLALAGCYDGRVADGFHSLAEKRSWALHQEVAARLRAQPDLVVRTRARVRGWLQDPASHPYAAEWQALLALSLQDLCAALESRDARMNTLRQASPFAGILDSRTRWQILKRPDLNSREAG